MPQHQSRRLAEAMRALPSRYADRLPTRTIDRVAGVAAGGEWEKAVETLINALITRSVPVSVPERDQLGPVVDALGLPADWIEDCIRNRKLSRPPTPPWQHQAP